MPPLMALQILAAVEVGVVRPDQLSRRLVAGAGLARRAASSSTVLRQPTLMRSVGLLRDRLAALVEAPAVTVRAAN